MLLESHYAQKGMSYSRAAFWVAVHGLAPKNHGAARRNMLIYQVRGKFGGSQSLVE